MSQTKAKSKSVIVKGVEMTACASKRGCKTCGRAPGFHHKHCKCGVEADGVDELGVLFGWRKNASKPGHVMPQSQCRSCRSSKPGTKPAPSVVKPIHPLVKQGLSELAAVEEELSKPVAPTPALPAPPTPTPIPAEPDPEEEMSKAPTQAPVLESKCLHVMPILPTVKYKGDPKPLYFGPINIAPNVLNTVEGQSMVPDVDKHFSMEADEAVILANAIANAENTWVWGHSGTGKTSGIVQICALLNRPLYRINMSGDVSIDDIIGSPQVVVDEATSQGVTRFAYGRLIKAMLNGGVLLIDEITSAPPHVLMALQQVSEPCDNVHEVWKKGKAHAKYVCTANEGETIHAAKGFRIIVTDNTNGQGDTSGLFAGTNAMNEAFRSRFSQWHEKGFPSAITWRQIIVAKTGIDAKQAEKIVEVAKKVNKGSAIFDNAKTVTNNMVINPRDTLAIARLSKVYGKIKVAFHVGLINGMKSCDPDRVFLKDLVKNML